MLMHGFYYFHSFKLSSMPEYLEFFKNRHDFYVVVLFKQVYFVLRHLSSVTETTVTQRQFMAKCPKRKLCSPCTSPNRI